MVALSLLKIAAGFFLSSSPEFLADRTSNLPVVNDEGGVLTVGDSNPCTAGEFPLVLIRPLLTSDILTHTRSQVKRTTP